MRSSMQRLVSAAVLVTLASVLTGCGGASSWDPSDLLDFMDTKKKLPGDRKPVFPEGVPGLEQGVPAISTRKASSASRPNRPPLLQPPQPRRHRPRQVHRPAARPQSRAAAVMSRSAMSARTARPMQPLRKRAALPASRSRQPAARSPAAAPPRRRRRSRLPHRLSSSNSSRRRHSRRRCPREAFRVKFALAFSFVGA